MATVNIHRLEEATISDELIEKIYNHLKEEAKRSRPKIYWDYRDEVSDETIKKAIEAAEKGEVEKAIYYIGDDVQENNLDNVHDIEQSFIKDGLDEFEDDLRAELGLDEDEHLDMDELASELREHLTDAFYVDYDIKGLLSNTSDVHLRIEMYSNYDCINSHWLESQGAYEMDSYFGDMVRMLQFNPADVKKLLVSKGYNVAGRWPNQPKKQPLISLEDFYTEHINTCCGANLLTFVATADAYEFLDKYNKECTITIPKGNRVSMFSSMQGGGGPFDAVLLRDFTIDLSKSYDKSGYLSFGLHLDDSNGYGIDRVYGVSSSFFGDNITIHE